MYDGFYMQKCVVVTYICAPLRKFDGCSLIGNSQKSLLDCCACFCGNWSGWLHADDHSDYIWSVRLSMVIEVWMVKCKNGSIMLQCCDMLAYLPQVEEFMSVVMSLSSVSCRPFGMLVSSVVRAICIVKIFIKCWILFCDNNLILCNRNKNRNVDMLSTTVNHYGKIDGN